ncbi:MAG: HAD-IA family hydrolase [Rhodospirillum sp.]|nr:HAD-IA family hydrolase [Rhodospirillum sp.]MCF8490902.1 HAD-IA family hydrolase [Rhodospirillum sp.]MCF8499920.1 HAD-IA family hydrolase [Rhodospirillum sp.]
MPKLSSFPGPPPLPKAMVFDLDGTLVHSLPGLTLALNALFSETGLSPLTDTEVETMVGDGAPMLLARAHQARGLYSGAPDDPELAPHLARFLEIYNADPITGAAPYPGAKAFLTALAARGVALGVCTNKPEAPARAMLAGLGLDGPLGSIIGGDTLPQRKPDAAPLLRCLTELGVPPEEALMVGDAGPDVGTARAAGTAVRLLAHGYCHVPLESLEADAIHADFAALAESFGLDLEETHNPS